MIEIVFAIVGVYNLAKASYSMYNDADYWKTRYKSRRREKIVYKLHQGGGTMTASTIDREINDFVLL